MFYAVSFPKASGTAVVLLFDDNFLEVKASIFKYTAHFTAHRYDMPLLRVSPISIAQNLSSIV